jgi:aminoglycoside phosphotransferase (APT) family kinase protein
MGRVWRLSTDRGDFAAKQLFDWARGTERLDIEARVVEAAIAAGIVTPAPVRSVEGRLLETIGASRWRVFEWADLTRPLTRPLSSDDAVQLGAVVAGLHRMNLEADRAGIIPWHTARRPPSHWRALARRVREAGASWAPLLESALPHLIDLSFVADPSAYEGRCVLSHCDLNLGNVHRGPRGLIILDWEHAGAIPPLWELGGVIQAWTIGDDGVDDHEAARSIVRGYVEGGGAPGPFNVDVFAGAISGWLQWTMSRVFGAVAGTDPGERQRSEQSAIRLLTHPVTRARIEAAVAAIARC